MRARLTWLLIPLLLGLLSLLALVVAMTHALRQERLDAALVRAVDTSDTSWALALLREGANPNQSETWERQGNRIARVASEPQSAWVLLRHWLHRQRRYDGYEISLLGLSERRQYASLTAIHAALL